MRDWGLGMRDWGLDQRERDDPGFRAFDNAHDLRDVSGAEHSIDLRNLRLQLVAIALAKTSRDDEPLAGAGLFELGQLEDRVDRLLLGRVDERACVYDEHIGFGWIGRQR